jgi:1,2-diacylglycerol 3-alpha-glucosyltransferase
MEIPMSLASLSTFEPCELYIDRTAALQPENESHEPPLKVCVLAACPFPANHGTPGSIRELVEATAERGHEVHVVTYHIGEELSVAGARLHRIGNWTGERQVIVGPTRYRPLYDFQMIFKTIEVMWRYQLDLMHAHGYESALVAGCCRPFVQRPVLYSAHNCMGDELASYDFFRSTRLANALAWVLDRVVPRIGDRCIPHSANLQQFLAARGLAERSEPILNFGINLDRAPFSNRGKLRRRYGIKHEPVILYSGVVDRFQRLDLLLGAMVHVLRYAPQAKLLLVNTVPNSKHQGNLRAEAVRLGIAESILWMQPSAMDESLEILPACDIAVVPRPAAPGFPIKLLNYMAAKRPCVMFRSSASGVVHGEHVWLANEDTSESLAAGIIRLLDDLRLQSRLGVGGYRFVHEHHDRRVVARRLCEAYVDLIKASKRWKEVAQRTWSGEPIGNGGQAEVSAVRAEACCLEAGGHATA